jgi:MFS family permease
MPTWGLATSIVLRVLENPTKEFGPIRVWATFGWMAAGWANSYLLRADLSPRAGLAAAGVWLIVAALTFLLPTVQPVAEASRRSWRELLGLEALSLLRHRDHSVVFVTAALVSIPLAAFYPFASMQLHELGEERVAITMSLGQVTEIIAMYALAPLLARFRMKWVLLAGIGFGIIRYGLFTLNTKAAVLAGITLHGLCFTLFYIPAQMYLDRRIDRRLHARAQALLTLMVSGVGTLAGYLGCGWWREACLTERGTEWPLFWLVLTLFLCAVLVYFMIAYRGALSARQRAETTD